MRRMCLGFALSITLFASAAYALPMGIPIEDPSPSARNCVNASALPSADQPLFTAVVSGFFHDAPCTLGAFRVIVFRYTVASPASSDRVTLDVLIDETPKTISGVNVYEIVGRVAEELRVLPMRTQPVPLTARTAVLKISSDPTNATVTLDGRTLDSPTPVAVPDVAPGSHRVLVRKPGYVDNDQEFDLLAGQEREITVVLGTHAVGYLRINSKPWAEVWIDGRNTGIGTPLMKHQVPAGRHTVTLRNSRSRCESTFDVAVKAGETVSLVKQLECRGAP